jgi:hypothetical protein
MKGSITLSGYAVRERYAAGIFVAVFVALLTYNHSLRTRLQQLSGARHDSRAIGPASLAIGESILQFHFLTDDGAAVQAPTLLSGRPGTLFYFFKEGCPACQALEKDWGDYVALYGYSSVVFVSTDRGRGSSALPGPETRGLRAVRLVRDGAARARIRFVPQIVLIDSCGVVSGNFKSVREAAEVLRGASGPSKSSGPRDSTASRLLLAVRGSSI